MQDTPLGAIVERSGNTTRVHKLEEARSKALLILDTLQKCLREWHRTTAKLTAQRRKIAAEIYNRKTGIRSVHFTVVDFILKGTTKKGIKLQIKWLGLYRVTNCKSNYLFEVELLVSEATYVCHERGMNYF